jgi:hypothetical protein
MYRKTPHAALLPRLSTTIAVAVLSCCTLPSMAMKNRLQNYTEPCDAVWKATMSVAKSQDYRIISVCTEEQLVSLSVGGAWWGERIISLSLAPDAERGCVATVQSRYSGLLHSDAPVLVAPIHLSLIGLKSGARGQKVFQKLTRCIDSYNNDESKCVEKFRETVAKGAKDRPAQPNWNLGFVNN